VNLEMKYHIEKEIKKVKMKKTIFLVITLMSLAGCSSDEAINESSPTQNTLDGKGKVIMFTSGANAVTRATISGSAAADLLGKNFVVEGVKGDGTTSSVVYDNYNVNYISGSASTTTSNTTGWEYVNQPKNANASISAQTVKYWDFSAQQYDFIAYSLGNSTGLTVSAINAATKGTAAYTINGSAAELSQAYIADMVTAYNPSDYNKTVQFTFRPLSAKVRIALYETVPGYSVQDVVFYTDASTTATDGLAHLYATGSDVFNDAGTCTIYFPTTGSANTGLDDYNKAHLTFSPDATGGTSTVKDFGALDGVNTYVAKEYSETTSTDKLYIGRASNNATYAGSSANNYYTVVIPNESGIVLNLKVNYTLVSTDGSGELIRVTGATAQVPAVYASWKSGYAYTYLFKISQNSNGQTGTGTTPEGLFPISFDAVVTESEEGVQETITTVSEPSITTYTKGKVVTENDEYNQNNTIYVVVDNGTALTVGTNANLYKATLEDTDTSDGITTAAQTINEVSIANALAQGGTVTDANKFKLTVTSIDGGLTSITEIAAIDSPTGEAITINGAKFTPTVAGTYVFEYIDTVNSKKYYKIIKVQ